MHIPGKAPSRANKKQIAAHISPDLLASMKAFCKANDLSLQEMIAMAVNETARLWQREPLLDVSRDRLINRTKSPAKIKTEGPVCRTGRLRVAAFFDSKHVDRVKAAAKEFGMSQEKIIQSGIASLCGHVAEADKPSETVELREAA